MQVYFNNDRLKDGLLSLGAIEVGDIICVKGNLSQTKTNELSLRGIELNALTKSIRSFPDKHKGLKDSENISRHKSLDMIMN